MLQVNQHRSCSITAVIAIMSVIADSFLKWQWLEGILFGVKFKTRKRNIWCLFPVYGLPFAQAKRKSHGQSSEKLISVSHCNGHLLQIVVPKEAITSPVCLTIHSTFLFSSPLHDGNITVL